MEENTLRAHAQGAAGASASEKGRVVTTRLHHQKRCDTPYCGPGGGNRGRDKAPNGSHRTGPTEGGAPTPCPAPTPPPSLAPSRLGSHGSFVTAPRRVEEQRFARASGGGGGWAVVEAPIPAPPPPFWAHVTGTPDGLTGPLMGRPGRLGGGGGGGPEVPQHKWLKIIPHDALIIVRYVSWGIFFLEKNRFRAALWCWW